MIYEKSDRNFVPSGGYIQKPKASLKYLNCVSFLKKIENIFDKASPNQKLNIFLNLNKI